MTGMIQKSWVRQVMIPAALPLVLVLFWLGRPSMARQQPSQAAGRTVTGTVVDDSGKPVTKAQVRLLVEQKDSGPGTFKPGQSPTGDASIGAPAATPLQKDPGSVGGGERTFKTANVDSQGKFTFTNVPKGQYKVSAASGKRSVRVELTVKEDADPAPLTLKLPK